MPKFNSDKCEVCGESVIDISKLPEHIREKVYVPSQDELDEGKGNFEIRIPRREAFGDEEDEESGEDVIDP